MYQPLSKVILINGFEDKGTQCLVHAGSEAFSFFKAKKDGNPTKAWSDYQKLGAFDPSKEVTLRVFYNVNGRFQNAIGFEFANPQEPVVPFHTETHQQTEDKRTDSILWQVAWKVASNLYSGTKDLLAAQDAASKIYAEFKRTP